MKKLPFTEDDVEFVTEGLDAYEEGGTNNIVSMLYGAVLGVSIFLYFITPLYAVILTTPPIWAYVILSGEQLSYSAFRRYMKLKKGYRNGQKVRAESRIVKIKKGKMHLENKTKIGLFELDEDSKPPKAGNFLVYEFVPDTDFYLSCCVR